jgi:amidase
MPLRVLRTSGGIEPARQSTSVGRSSMRAAIHLVVLLGVALWTTEAVAQAPKPFQLEEASIGDIHAAIRAGQTTCAQIVQGYVARARAYNGVCTALITPDGADVAAATGTTRAGAPLKFPTDTVAATDLFPDFARYKGDVPDFGRMEPTMSDPTVQQQYGMVAGIPNAGQVNALEVLNIRGERSVTCKGAFDTHPSTGPLPAGAPAACEEFRKLPDALETAAALDAKYGRNPDLDAMPLYCAAMSFKAVYDTKDMRSTGGGDVSYATDFAPTDSTLVARVRDAGAIIYAHAHNSEYNGGSGNPGGDAAVEHPAIRTTPRARRAARAAAPARRLARTSSSARSANRRAARAATPVRTTVWSRSSRRKA